MESGLGWDEEFNLDPKYKVPDVTRSPFKRDRFSG